MRVTSRFLVAAILLVAAAGVARAQGASAVPPPSSPDVAKPVAPADTTSPKTVAPMPPEVKAAAVSTRSEVTKPRIRISVAGWSYAGVVVAALVGIATLTWRRRTHRRTSIVDLRAISPGLKPSHAPRH